MLAGKPATGMLHADGILDVKGMSADEAKITVAPANGATYSLTEGTTRFVLDLELNNSYIVTFERPGCLTKELYFDTSVPEDYLHDHYTFPFSVDLEPKQHDQLAYSGPVGYIRYMERVNDFDYETDYSLITDERLKERNDQQQAAPIARVDAEGIGEQDDRAVEMPVRRTSVSVAPVASPVVNATAPRAFEVHDKTDDDVRPEPMEPRQAMPDPTPAGPDLAYSAKRRMAMEHGAQHSTAWAATPESSSAATSSTPVITGRHEELVVEERKVTTIVRIYDDRGHGHEYRRVAHHFGPVFYFMDDQSIPEHMYRDRTGMPAHEE